MQYWQYAPENPDGLAATVVVEDILVSTCEEADDGKHALGNPRNEGTDGRAVT